MSQIDRHLTTEQLSGLLDEQMSSEEIAISNAHLYTCERCQQELEGLRQTVKMLHALPTPVLPRSFVLPSTTAATPALMQEKISARTKIVHTPPTHLAGNQPHVYMRRALRLSSALVAVIGLVFVISGLMMSLPHLGATSGAASTTSSLAVPRAPSMQGQGQVSTPVIRTMVTTSAVQKRSAAPVATDTDRDNDQTPVMSAHTPKDAASVDQPASDSPQSPPAFVPFFDLNSQAGRLGLGILLCIAGMMGYTLFAQRKKSIAKKG